jgi:8-oxo-dGTP pyrophosphatase MutT (NUDIX family)
MLGRPAQLIATRSGIVTLGAQGLIVDQDKRVLLLRHGYRPGWHFPGGGVERGEEIDHALHREVREETGIEITAPPQLLGIYAHFDEYPGDHIVLYLIEHWHRDAIPKPNVEIAEQSFFALNELPDGVSKGTRRRLAEVFEGVPRADHW